MAREVTPPPAVSRSRDGYMALVSLVSLTCLVAGVLVGLYGDDWRGALMLFLLAALGVLAAAMRLFNLRKNVTTRDLQGVDEE